jgi:hypothetical protein
MFLFVSKKIWLTTNSRRFFPVLDLLLFNYKNDVSLEKSRNSLVEFWSFPLLLYLLRFVFECGRCHFVCLCSFLRGSIKTVYSIWEALITPNNLGFSWHQKSAVTQINKRNNSTTYNIPLWVIFEELVLVRSIIPIIQSSLSSKQ